MTTLEKQVSDRLGAQVAALTGHVEDIAALAVLIAEGALPNADVCAFVVPLGFDDRGGESATGYHTQILDNAVGVILCIKARGDVKAKKALPTLAELKDAVIAAVAGWGPADAAGVFFVRRGRLLSAEGGLVLYQLDFSQTDQLRIV
ncbi:MULTISPECIES: phage tail terminator protein [unclassified Bradyrhizobium]|uniref:phage tail terminator protein n=1 Tax=unclassified Bradyrhizobium TaxID=2631580 RepID=UPI00211DB7D2|nr:MULTISPECIES: hypothetical protein [unclassified Bradyrhizobium]MDD1534563.1 hypothetical protein [Bradyrhizobium sp. WBOS8]MDD1581427.1 hypothetical protein [Bradyrhizobium sp. WBOS4]UUO49716.1 hypothetical protein DCM78_24080 [Bradyrhizobium sp. WBOS04]UUO58481.1 hypothetical protein DCM80_04355 [Bradyrhizobium sp. WBOS08]